jgi:exodeoxyribonuclease V alpha subunit
MRDLPPPVRDALDRVAGSDAAAAIDVALGRTLAGLDREHGSDDDARARTVALSTALLSAVRREGHSAVSLAEWAGERFPGDGDDPLPSLPALADWRRHLEASPAVGPPGSACPLILHDGRLALARFWHAERRVAEAVRQRLKPEAINPTPELHQAIRALFGQPEHVDWQMVATIAALRSRIVLVAGGPGTGKTYTATRLLALLQAARPGLRIALAAPTGKAAQRLGESLAAGREALPEDLGAGVPVVATTLHRLLRYHPARGFGHDARRPLPVDLVLIDEGSMVDLPLFDALLAALPAEARLVVLGDPDQLASVEAGAVFADLYAEGAGPADPGLAALCEAFGLSGVPSDPNASPLASAVVTLTESRRFGMDSGVGRLALALRDGDADGVRTVLSDPAFPDAHHAGGPTAEAAVEWLLPHARLVATSGTPEEALRRLEAFRLLAVVRRGPRGVEGLNAAVEAALRAEGAARWSAWGEPFYDGRPLLITANDDATRLANGDVGVCWTEGGERVVCFPDGAGGARRIAWNRLPEHETAWALTVHKSQGSEFDAVGLALPNPDERGADLVSRELLYTAVTRARRSVTVFGPLELVATSRRQRRTSGLRERLAVG